MKNSALEPLFYAIDAIKDVKSIKFSYAMLKNKKAIAEELDAFTKTITPSEEYKKFDVERIKLGKEHAKKDEQGNPITRQSPTGEQYVIENMEAFKKAVDDLKEKHKEAVDLREAQLNEFNKLMEEDTKLQFHKVKLSDVPEGVTQGQLDGIFDLIEE